MTLYNFIFYAVSFAFVLGILIFFHELGHFLVAKLCKVGVEKFSLGFGPRLIGKKVGITDYRISAVPLGGYVKMVGDEPDSELREEDIPISFNHKPVYLRMMIVAAGPVFNFVLSGLIFFLLHLQVGYLVPKIGSFTDDSVALSGGMKKGDLITQVNDTRIEVWTELTDVIAKSQGKPLRISVLRDGRPEGFQISPKLTVIDTPEMGKSERYMIGISPTGDKFHDFFRSLKDGVFETYRYSVMMVDIVWKLITGAVPRNLIGGPILIAQEAGQQAKLGVANLFWFIALLSINLAILNLVPVPPLDGGHLFYFIIEWVIGRPVNLKIREISQQAGVLVLMMLMIYVFYNDISRVLSAN